MYEWIKDLAPALPLALATVGFAFPVAYGLIEAPGRIRPRRQRARR